MLQKVVKNAMISTKQLLLMGQVNFTIDGEVYGSPITNSYGPSLASADDTTSEQEKIFIIVLFGTHP